MQTRNPRRRPALLTTVITAGLLAACAGGSGAPSTPARSFEEISMSSPRESEPDRSTLPIGDVPRDLIEAILADAADRTGVDVNEVEVVEGESVTWNDGSLGCPEPGMMYTQALVPGYRVVVEADGQELHFHAAESGHFVFCENPRPPLEGGGTQ